MLEAIEVTIAFWNYHNLEIGLAGLFWGLWGMIQTAKRDLNA